MSSKEPRPLAIGDGMGGEQFSNGEATVMISLRKKLHRLIEGISDEDLKTVWEFLTPLYEDAFMLKAIDDAHQKLRPGDALTREEALQVLYFDYGRVPIAPHGFNPNIEGI